MVVFRASIFGFSPFSGRVWASFGFRVQGNPERRDVAGGKQSRGSKLIQPIRSRIVRAILQCSITNPPASGSS